MYVVQSQPSRSIILAVAVVRNARVQSHVTLELPRLRPLPDPQGMIDVYLQTARLYLELDPVLVPVYTDWSTGVRAGRTGKYGVLESVCHHVNGLGYYGSGSWKVTERIAVGLDGLGRCY